MQENHGAGHAARAHVQPALVVAPSLATLLGALEAPLLQHHDEAEASLCERGGVNLRRGVIHKLRPQPNPWAWEAKQCIRAWPVLKLIQVGRETAQER